MNRRRLRTMLRTVLCALAALDPLTGQWPTAEETGPDGSDPEESTVV